MTESDKTHPAQPLAAMRTSRRQLLLASGAGAIALKAASATPTTAAAAPASPPARGSVVVPGGHKLPWKMVGNTKVFHLVAEEVQHEFAPGLRATCWGYNGCVHGPLLEMVEGDNVRVYVTNRLLAPTTVHWHGLFVPSGMDGVGGLNQAAIEPGETFLYEFTLKQHGTFMYHSHHDEMTQMALGMVGLIVVHPRHAAAIDHDFALQLHEWRIDAGATRPNPNEMIEFNVLTMNAKVFPATPPLVVKRGARVRLRFGNLSTMDHHSIHLHGHRFFVTATDGGEVPLAARWPETTVLVPVGSTRTVEFIADAPGDWAMHCHMTHHVMNQMGHGSANMIGVTSGSLDQAARQLLPGYMSMGQTGMGDMAAMGMPVPPNSIPMSGGEGDYGAITMGGMFTILKVRDTLPADATDPGWYAAPAGSVATHAKASDMARDGVDPDQPPRGV